jgi:hypothetical protein
MKKTAVLLIAAALALSVASPAFCQHTDEEIMQAFTYTFQMFFLTSIQSAFGVAIPGVAIDDTGMTFTDFLMPELEEKEGIPYISGRIEGRNEENIHADLILAGGPVRKLQWDLIGFSMEDQFDIVITADGKTLNINSADLQGESE